MAERIGIVRRVREDLCTARNRDPAARSRLVILLSYQGVHALWYHRYAHWLWRHGMRIPGRLVSQHARRATGIEIHPGAQIGRRVFIDHGMGVVIGETAIVGNDVLLFHGVTLGGTSSSPGKRHPTVGDRVTIGAGAKVLGNLSVGDDSRIGANAVLVRSVDDHSVVVGVPGQVIAHGITSEHDTRPKQDSPTAPDPVGLAVSTLLTRVDRLEEEVLGHEHEHHKSPQKTASGEWELDWRVSDFSI